MLKYINQNWILNVSIKKMYHVFIKKDVKYINRNVKMNESKKILKGINYKIP